MREKFPQVIYVRFEEDDEEGYLLADREPSGEDGIKVAIYRREEVKTIYNRVELE